MALQGSSGSGTSHSKLSRVTRYGLNPSAVEAFAKRATKLSKNSGKLAPRASQF